MTDGTTNNGFFLTLGAAAKQSGLGKATLSRAIRAGKLSAERCPETSTFKIDPSELQRFVEASRIVRAEHASTPQDPVAPAPETALLEERAARQLAEARLQDLKVMLDEARADRDRWHAQAERLALTGPLRERRSWWRWRRA